MAAEASSATASGWARNGSTTGAPTFSSTVVPTVGFPNSHSLQLNGANFASVPHESALVPQNYTVGAWVYLTNLTGSTQCGGADSTRAYIVHKRSATSGSGFEHFALQKNATGFMALVGRGDGSGSLATLTGTTVPATGRWYHVASSYDGAALRLYVDGVLEGLEWYAVPINTGSRPMFMSHW
jgi:hypothetical protein